MITAPDMSKVMRAVVIYGNPKVRVRDWREYPPLPSPVAHDAAIRKPLKAHGTPCRGWNCPHFLHGHD